jgi:small GTP-binding protein
MDPQPTCRQQGPTLAKTKTKLKCLVLGATSAGKTSFLRRFFYGKFEGNHRVPTVGSDFYTKLLTHPLASNSDTEQQQQLSISLQLWDTPGRERLDAKRQRQQPSLQESFLQQADAYMLVYDVTSSTSFKQLLKWYADLVKLGGGGDSSKSLPILIVGTKVDLLDHQGQSATNQPCRETQRNVLGLQHRHWKGYNYQYEYQVSRNDDTADDYQSKSNLQATRRTEISSYQVSRENWTTDWSYLDGLLSSEDGSHPDRDMVILWCGRNDLKHMEASAATGRGVDEAVRELVGLALDAKQQKANEAYHLQQNDASIQSSLSYNKSLDLHLRYASKDERCCGLRMLRCCRSKQV